MKLSRLVLSFVISFAAAGIGSLATIPNIPTWYVALEKPALNPPNWIFGPVWTVLYTLIAISLYMVWSSDTKETKTKACVVFGVQIVLDTIWSLVFFGLHQLWAGAVIIVMLIGAILLNIAWFRKLSKPAAYLLLPYLVWVCFATYLNIGIAVLN